MFANCSSLQYVNLSDYYGNNTFESISNYNILTICLNDYKQINTGSNPLKNNNVKNDCMKDNPSQNSNYLEKLVLLTSSIIIIFLIIKLMF